MAELHRKKSFRSLLAELPLKFLLVTGSFILFLMLFAWITHEVVFEKGNSLDRQIMSFVSSHATEALIRWMKFVTIFGSSKFFLPAYTVLVAYYIIKRKAILGLHIALIALSATALSFGFKRLFERARPDLPLIESLKTYSFPSGHALSSIVFCSILVYLLWRSNLQRLWRWILSVLLFVFAITIGASRIVLQVHYPTDVLAGFCLGLLWVIFSFYLLGLMKPKPREPVKMPL